MTVVVRLFESWTNLIGFITTGFDAIEFIFIGHIKTNVYKTKIKDLNDLKIRITRKIEDTPISEQHCRPLSIS